MGLVTNDHVKVSGSPSGSLEVLPSSVTACRTKTLGSGPAFATGGRLTSPTVHGKVTLLLSALAEAVTVTLNTRCVAGCATAVKEIVPMMEQVVGLMLSPGGKPLLLHVRGSPSGSTATI